MGLLDELNALEEEQKKADKGAQEEEKEEEAEETAGEEGESEEEKEEVEEKEEKKEEAKTEAEEEKEKKEDEPPHAGWVKARQLEREKRALEAQIEEMRKANTETVRVEQKKEVEDPEPDADEDPDAYNAWKIRQLEREVSSMKEYTTKTQREQEVENTYRGAVKEFQQYEAAFKRTVDDYDDVAEHLRNKIRDGLAVLYPQASEDEIEKAADGQILKMASYYAAKKLDPVEELYNLSKEKYNYVKQDKEEKEEGRKVDLKVVAANKKRSAGMVNAGGKGSSPRSAAKDILDGNMSPAEYKQLTPEEIEELEKDSRQFA